MVYNLDILRNYSWAHMYMLGFVEVNVTEVQIVVDF